MEKNLGGLHHVASISSKLRFYCRIEICIPCVINIVNVLVVVRCFLFLLFILFSSSSSSLFLLLLLLLGAKSMKIGIFNEIISVC